MSLEFGDIGTWLGSLTGAAALALGEVRRRRVESLLLNIDDLVDVNDQEVADRIRRNPELGALLLQALEESAKAKTDEKVVILARVVASALKSDDARVDEVAVFLRTAAALEPIDIRLLVTIATPRPDLHSDLPIVGAKTSEVIAASLQPDQAPLLSPILGVLSREGLIEDAALGTFDYEPAWRASPYGFRFLTFLPIAPKEWNHAVVVAVATRGGSLIVRNLGFADAIVTAVTATSDSTLLSQPLRAPIEMPAGRVASIPMDTTVGPNQLITITASWTDDDGAARRFERRQALH